MDHRDYDRPQKYFFLPNLLALLSRTPVSPDADVLLRGTAVQTNMTGNAHFSNPPVDLTILKTAIDVLAALIAQALEGTKKVIAQKNKQREAVIKMLGLLARYACHCYEADARYHVRVPGPCFSQEHLYRLERLGRDAPSPESQYYLDSAGDAATAGLFLLAAETLALKVSPSLAFPSPVLYRGALVCLPLIATARMLLRSRPDPGAPFKGSRGSTTAFCAVSFQPLRF